MTFSLIFPTCVLFPFSDTEPVEVVDPAFTPPVQYGINRLLEQVKFPLTLFHTYKKSDIKNL